MADRYSDIDFKPPQSVADAASKGLKYRQKALALLDVLDQPGRKFDMPGLIRALGISGAEIKSVTNTIRRLLVLNPDINESDLYRKLSQGNQGKTAMYRRVIRSLLRP